MHEDLDRYPPFPGRERLLAALDHAVQQPDITLITHTLQQVLREAIADAQIALPACVHEPVADHYARRELYHSPVHGYSVVAMTWGPGQATPLHDHSCSGVRYIRGDAAISSRKNPEEGGRKKAAVQHHCRTCNY